MKSGFKSTISWNKYQSTVTLKAENPYLDYLIDPSFKTFCFNNAVRTRHRGYFLASVETKDGNVMIDGQNIFDQPVKNDMRTYDNIRKIATGQADDYTIGCLLDYSYFKKHYKLIAIDLRK